MKNTLGINMNTQVFAHRGASGYAPENTIEAIELANNLGAHGIEIDVQLTRDNLLVVCHDERIDRVSNGIGRIADMRYSELKKLKFNRTHPEYANAKLSTLQEILEFVKDTNMHINIELKNSRTANPILEEKCLECVALLGMEERVLFSSFNHHSMVALKNLQPKAYCGLLYAHTMVEPWKYAKTLGVDAIHPEYHELLLIEDTVAQAHTNCLQVNTWTVNEDQAMKSLILKGVDRLITNYPDRALSVLNQLNKGAC